LTVSRAANDETMRPNRRWARRDLHMTRIFPSYRFRSDESGQTMAEYGVVLAVVTLGVILALTALAGGISGAINSVVGAL
jgi:Flp pilus assembly pilin Flp